MLFSNTLAAKLDKCGANACLKAIKTQSLAQTVYSADCSSYLSAPIPTVIKTMMTTIDKTMTTTITIIPPRPTKGQQSQASTKSQQPTKTQGSQLASETERTTKATQTSKTSQANGSHASQPPTETSQATASQRTTSKGPQNRASLTALPSYATGCAPAAYSSACSCLGVKSSQPVALTSTITLTRSRPIVVKVTTTAVPAKHAS